jgi:hypothetical protein
MYIEAPGLFISLVTKGSGEGWGVGRVQSLLVIVGIGCDWNVHKVLVLESKSLSTVLVTARHLNGIQ